MHHELEQLLRLAEHWGLSNCFRWHLRVSEKRFDATERVVVWGDGSALVHYKLVQALGLVAYTRGQVYVHVPDNENAAHRLAVGYMLRPGQLQQVNCCRMNIVQLVLFLGLRELNL